MLAITRIYYPHVIGMRAIRALRHEGLLMHGENRNNDQRSSWIVLRVQGVRYVCCTGALAGGTERSLPNDCDVLADRVVAGDPANKIRMSTAYSMSQHWNLSVRRSIYVTISDIRCVNW